jgi:mono/diheme cytochrome c family protein
MNLAKTLVATMILVGIVIGFIFFAPYAVPAQHSQEDEIPGAQTFGSVCTTCHEPDRIQNYQGDQNWHEIITLMRSFGAMVNEEQAGEIEQYLEATYPKD